MLIFIKFFINLAPSRKRRGFRFAMAQNETLPCAGVQSGSPKSWKEAVMKIERVEQIENLRGLIGDQNAAACQRALADGAQLWVVRSEEELIEEKDLTPKEREFCRKELKELGWAGICRSKPRPTRYVPGFTAAPGYDSHGNSTEGEGGWHDSHH